MPKLNRVGVALAVLAQLAGCGGADAPPPERTRRAAVALSDTVARTAAATPSTGRWDEGHLVERLVRGGMAPQRRDGVAAEAFMSGPVLAFSLGRAELFVYLYPDSTARRRVTDGLDPVTAAPPGRPSPYVLPRSLIVQNNLAAVLAGANERTTERVRLAIEAGLPVSP